MITAIDTNVLLDVFAADPRFGPLSRELLSRCRDEGALLVSDIVWAETGAAFPDPNAAHAALSALGATFGPSIERTASTAGVAWRAYRAAGGPRIRLAANFLVGAHALVQADRLLSRDRGFYRRYFTELTVLDPTAP